MANPPTQLRGLESTLLPDPARWPQRFSIPTSRRALNSRAQLGIPVDRPVVASGHQPIVFHPGIVAKLVAMDHWAKRTGGARVWIVPDQDVVDPATIRVPVQSGDRLGVEHVLLSDQAVPEGPSSTLPPIAVRPDLPEQLQPLADWLTGYEHEATLARQFASATIGLLCEWLGLEEPTLIYASDLLATEAGGAMLDALLQDPRGAANAYNHAITRHPDAGVRPLAISETSIELPLWKIDGHSRTPLVLEPDHAPDFDAGALLPRGLLMTAIVRSSLSELFIHGTGGYHYDRITQDWMQHWGGVELSPIAGATATVTLDLPISGEADPDRAAWMAHHARHDPLMLGDQEAADQKAALVSGIAEAKATGDRAQAGLLFSRLQSLLANLRERHAEELSELDQAAGRASATRDQRAIASDRTWAFPLYPIDQLRSLRDQIVQKLDA